MNISCAVFRRMSVGRLSLRERAHFRGAKGRVASRLPRALLLAVAIFTAGCSKPTEVDRDNRRLLDAILTAITMKNTEWLEEDAKLLEKRHDAGQLTDSEHGKLLAIIDKARSGDWKSAEQAGYEFRGAHPFVKEGQ